MNRLILALVAGAAFAQDARQIVETAQERNRTNSQRYEGILEVLDSGGKVSGKRWRYDRAGSYGHSKVVLRFVAPAEVKGVALLIVNHPDRSSDQWMWTPALQRERRIAFQDRKARFFGTDFSFEDLEERDVDQYEYRLLGEETVDGQPCWKIESRPRQTKTSQYTRTVGWIRKDIYVFVRWEMYIKEEMVKRLSYRNIQRVQNVWTPMELEMNDLRRKSRTVMKTEKLQYSMPMKDEDFTLQALRRES